MATRKRPIAASVAEELRRALIDARTRLLRTVTATDDELTTLEAHQPGAPAEDAPREQALATLARVDDRERAGLAEIDAAYTRLAAGVFGRCERCRARIPLARLRAMPVARFCIRCQTGLEAEGHRFSRAVGTPP